MYGLDANIATPPLSAIISILLVVGSDYIGRVFIRFLLRIDVLEVKWMRWQAPIIGVSLLSVVIYPMALFGVANRSNLRILAALLIVLACVHIIRSCKVNFHKIKARWNRSAFDYHSWDVMSVTILSLIWGYLLFALSPVTNADSLDYHMGVAIEILNTGGIFNTPEWFHSRLSGNGEVLNALGVSVGAEQFGSLLQFTALIGIAALILYSEGGNNKLNKLLAILVLSTPVFIFLVGSSKYQLLPIAMNILALSLVVYPSQRNLEKGQRSRIFFLICLLVMVSSQAKLNYLLSGGVIGLIALLTMFRNKLLLQSVVLGFFVASIVIFPVIFAKSVLYSVGYVEAFLTPLPGSFPGTEMFEISIRNGRDTSILFPFSLVFPSGIGTITTVIGVGIFAILFVDLKNDKWVRLVVISAIVVFIVTLIFGLRSSRSYLEPYLWILIALSLQKEVSFSGWAMLDMKPLILMQSMGVIVLCWFGVVSAFPGALSTFWRTQVMTDTANGYTVMKWVDKTLPLTASLLTSHRSMALAPRRAMSLDWLRHIDSEKDNVSLYLNRIKNEGISHILVIGALHKSKEYQAFYGCLGEKIYGPGYGFTATRNPYNIGGRYSAWLLEIDINKLPECFSTHKNIYNDADSYGFDKTMSNSYFIKPQQF
jgi:hypothetical protein